MQTDFPEVLVVPEGTSAEALAVWAKGGPMPPGARPETFAEFSGRGRVADCDCQLIQCVCSQARPHVKDCQFRVALTCAIPIACEEHDLEVCPTCDRCTCETLLRAQLAALEAG